MARINLALQVVPALHDFVISICCLTGGGATGVGGGGYGVGAGFGVATMGSTVGVRMGGGSGAVMVIGGGSMAVGACGEGVEAGGGGRCLSRFR